MAGCHHRPQLLPLGRDHAYRDFVAPGEGLFELEISSPELLGDCDERVHAFGSAQDQPALNTLYCLCDTLPARVDPDDLRRLIDGRTQRGPDLAPGEREQYYLRPGYPARVQLSVTTGIGCTGDAVLTVSRYTEDGRPEAEPIHRDTGWANEGCPHLDVVLQPEPYIVTVSASHHGWVFGYTLETTIVPAD